MNNPWPSKTFSIEVRGPRVDFLETLTFQLGMDILSLATSEGLHLLKLRSVCFISPKKPTKQWFIT